MIQIDATHLGNCNG